jgi:hypothetical protein
VRCAPITISGFAYVRGHGRSEQRSETMTDQTCGGNFSCVGCAARNISC